MSLWDSTTKPASSSIWVMAWCRPAGSGMYGRVTSVGNQKWTVAGLSAVKPASARSCAARLRIEGVRRHAALDHVGPLAGVRHEGGGHRAAAAVEGRDQRLLVDRQLDRLPDVEILQRGLAGVAVVGPARRRRVLARDRVQAQVQGVEREPLHQLEAVAGDRLVVGRRLTRSIALDAAALQRLQARGRIVDGPDDQLVEQGLLAPVVLVADQGGFLVRACTSRA